MVTGSLKGIGSFQGYQTLVFVGIIMLSSFVCGGLVSLRATLISGIERIDTVAKKGKQR